MLRILILPLLLTLSLASHADDMNRFADDMTRLFRESSAIPAKTDKPQRFAKDMSQMFNQSVLSTHKAFPTDSQAHAWTELKKALKIKQESQLYIFVSLSMPENLLLQYQRDAALSGAALVVRGIPKGLTMKEYIAGRIKGLFGSLGVQAPIQIDPRLFDRFDIQAVPTIVYEPQSSGLDVPCKLNAVCEKAPESAYSSISGNVTLGYALEQFEASGDDTGAFLSRLSAGGQNQAKGLDKKTFTEQMQNVWKQNSELMEKQLEAQGYGNVVKRFKTPFGYVFAPANFKAPLLTP